MIIKKEPNCLILENPGYIRVGKKQMIHGRKSAPRKKALMKMFNLINIGERAGSGVPNIFQTWEHENWMEPVINETFGPDRTVLTLSFVDKTTRSTTQVPPKHHPNTTQTTQSTTQFSRFSSERGSVYNLLEVELSIISLLQNHPEYSQAKIAGELKMDLNLVKYYVRKLRQRDILSREGSSRKGFWIVKI